MYIPNDDKNNVDLRLQLVVKTFEHSTKWTNQSKLNKSPKGVKPTKKTLFKN